MSEMREAASPSAGREPHACPVCHGAKHISRPPHIAGDVAEWTSAGSETYPCGACNATGIVWPSAGPEDDGRVGDICTEHFGKRRDGEAPPICDVAFAKGLYPCEFAPSPAPSSAGTPAGSGGPAVFIRREVARIRPALQRTSARDVDEAWYGANLALDRLESLADQLGGTWTQPSGSVPSPARAVDADDEQPCGVCETALTDVWYDHFLNRDVHLCSLCGNSGVVDTRATAISGAGVNAGRLNYCICPNGQAMREAGEGLAARSPSEDKTND